jgi:hypothetical protein
MVFSCDWFAVSFLPKNFFLENQWSGGFSVVRKTGKKIINK